MLGFISTHNRWIAISNLTLRRLYNALCCELLLPSASTLAIISRRKYSLTVDAIKKQLPSRNEVSLALDEWTSTNKLAITSVTAYNMDWNHGLQEAQLTFDEVDSLFVSYSESYWRTLGQWSKYCSKVIQTFERSFRWFCTYWWPFTWNYD